MSQWIHPTGRLVAVHVALNAAHADLSVRSGGRMAAFASLADLQCPGGHALKKNRALTDFWLDCDGGCGKRVPMDENTY